MRQLFLPACVCLVTWSGPTNPDARFTLEEFTGRTLLRAGVANAAPSETTGSESRDDVRMDLRNENASVQIKIPEDAFAAAQPEPLEQEVPAASIAPQPAAQSPDDILANLSIEYPVPSGVVVNGGIPAGIPLPPIAKPVIARSEEEICDSLTKSAQINNLPAPFFIRLLFQESGFKPGAISAVGAQGIAQFMPATAEGMGVENPFDPRQAIPASARLLNELLQKFGNLGLAAAAYNAGPKRIQDWLSSKGKGKLPEETQGYVKTITGKPVESWTSADARHPGAKLPKRAPCQESAGLLAYNGPDVVPVPQPSPLRAPPVEKTPEKPALVASARSNAKHADSAERIADAAKSVKPVVAKLEAKTTAKTDAKSDAKSEKRQAVVINLASTNAKIINVPQTAKKNDHVAKAAVKTAAKRRVKTADAGQPLKLAAR